MENVLIFLIGVIAGAALFNGLMSHFLNMKHERRNNYNGSHGKITIGGKVILIYREEDYNE